MKVALISAVFLVTVAIASGLTCMTEKEKCAEDECCVKIGPVGHCKKMKQADDRCEMHPGKHLIFNHMYLVMCPCTEGMKCEGEGLVGKVIGKCIASSTETTGGTDE